MTHRQAEIDVQPALDDVRGGQGDFAVGQAGQVAQGGQRLEMVLLRQ